MGAENFSSSVQLDIQLNTKRELSSLQATMYYFVYYINTLLARRSLSFNLGQLRSLMSRMGIIKSKFTPESIQNRLRMGEEKMSPPAFLDSLSLPFTRYGRKYRNTKTLFSKPDLHTLRYQGRLQLT